MAALKKPGQSLRAQRQRLADEFRKVGAGQLSDSFFVPVMSHRSSACVHYARTQTARWRQHEREFWIRVAELPFDLLPYRPHAPERRGAFFSIGPGLHRNGREHPAVVLLQLEGLPEEVAAMTEQLDAVLRANLDDHQRGTEESSTVAWHRSFHAGILRLGAETVETTPMIVSMS